VSQHRTLQQRVLQNRVSQRRVLQQIFTPLVATTKCDIKEFSAKMCATKQSAPTDGATNRVPQHGCQNTRYYNKVSQNRMPQQKVHITGCHGTGCKNKMSQSRMYVTGYHNTGCHITRCHNTGCQNKLSKHIFSTQGEQQRVPQNRLQKRRF